MKYIITEDCVSCGACEFNCPENCIKNNYGLYIEKDKCINCDLCRQVCPVDAIEIQK